MKQTLKYIQVEYDQPISILCDNTSAINISRNPSCIQKQNIFQSSITSSERKSQNKMSNWSILAQKNKLQIYLQNLFLEKYLSILDKNWGWSLCPPTTKSLQEEHQLKGSYRKRDGHRLRGRNIKDCLL
jgi:hypothetical protein